MPRKPLLPIVGILQRVLWRCLSTSLSRHQGCGYIGPSIVYTVKYQYLFQKYEHFSHFAVGSFMGTEIFLPIYLPTLTTTLPGEFTCLTNLNKPLWAVTEVLFEAAACS